MVESERGADGHSEVAFSRGIPQVPSFDHVIRCLGVSKGDKRQRSLLMDGRFWVSDIPESERAPSCRSQSSRDRRTMQMELCILLTTARTYRRTVVGLARGRLWLWFAPFPEHSTKSTYCCQLHHAHDHVCAKAGVSAMGKGNEADQQSVQRGLYTSRM
jgi:hypothetical protein